VSPCCILAVLHWAAAPSAGATACSTNSCALVPTTQCILMPVLVAGSNVAPYLMTRCRTQGTEAECCYILVFCAFRSASEQQARCHRDSVLAAAASSRVPDSSTACFSGAASVSAEALLAASRNAAAERAGQCDAAADKAASLGRVWRKRCVRSLSHIYCHQGCLLQQRLWHACTVIVGVCCCDM
jgi:hypothetical protein